MPDYRVRRSKSTENLPEIIELLADAVAGVNLATRRRILHSATRGQRLLLGYYFYWDDVTNGGHRQYFWNYTGSLWPEALEATQVLGLAKEERILRDALALFPDKQPALTQSARRAQLAKITSTKASASAVLMASPTKFDKLDDRFIDLPGGDKAVRRYIDKHPDEFFLPRRS